MLSATALLLTITVSNAYAADNIFVATTGSNVQYNRIYGETRYDTAANIAKDGWKQADYAIIANGENYPDVLAAAPLA